MDGHLWFWGHLYLFTLNFISISPFLSDRGSGVYAGKPRYTWLNNSPRTAPYNVEFSGFAVIGQVPVEQPMNL